MTVLSALPPKAGTISDSGYLLLSENSVAQKMTVAQMLAKISQQYSTDINTFLASTDNLQARNNLAIDRRVTVNNADYTILNSDKLISQIGTMTAPRTFTLPAANTVQAGAMFFISDESGTVNSTNYLTISRSSTDLIDGLTKTILNQPNGKVVFYCNGVDAWKILSIGLANNYLQTNNKSLLNIITNTGTPNTHIDITGGLVTFADGSQFYAPAMTKNFGSLFVAGNNNGGLQVSRIANKWYYIYAILNSTDNSIDYIATPEGTALVLPTNYIKSSFVGCFMTDGSVNNRKFQQIYDEYIYGSTINDFGGTTDTTAGVFVSISAPLLPIKANLHGRGYLATGTGTSFFRVWSPLQNDETVTSNNAISGSGSTSGANGAAYSTSVITTNAQVRKRASVSMDATSITISSFKYL